MVTKVIGYGRVSTDKQELSLESQEQMCRQWFDMQSQLGKWPDGAKWMGMLVDDAVSSTIPLLQRPKGQLIPVVLDSGDTVVVAKDNRAFRSAADTEQTLEKLTTARISMVMLNLNIDTSTYDGQMIAAIFGAVGRREREQLRENTREAILLRKRMGRPYSCPPPGWTIVNNGKTGREKRSWFKGEPVSRRIGAYCARRIREGVSIGDIFNELVIHRKKHGRKVGINSICKLAVYHLHGWPRLTQQEMREKYGEEVFSVETVRNFEEE